MTTHDIDEDHQRHPDWVIVRRNGWCTSCCVPATTCGCPTAEAQLDQLRAQHLDSMGSE